MMVKGDHNPQIFNISKGKSLDYSKAPRAWYEVVKVYGSATGELNKAWCSDELVWGGSIRLNGSI